ncbi:putative calcium binding EF-hand protein [Chlamydia ibidis]|uniref:Calcium binding EF-hand protein n=2 Tax=Chlamydia ibidis TaxID=1405396 RepID=A0ABN0MYM4_9CHLA|nr:hypothetical protein [Chlamydia ibidis]EPP34658.1 putative calcium binding EF-hand protein [Chlamydia ibidis]EQM62379.1 calcium binding EF-hand protein [Chlamydia ibidis 10-1398/6]
MRKSCYNFEKALEHLENLKKMSYGSSEAGFLNNPCTVSNVSRGNHSLAEMKNSLKSLEDYLKQAATLPTSKANKALQESHFLISGVQNISSFLESRERDLYHSLANDFLEINKIYSQIQEDLSRKIVKEDHSEPLARELTGRPEDDINFLNNLVEVKRDRSYELFYILDERNKRFYTDALAQIIYKQGKIHETAHENDPLTKTLLWNSEEVKKLASYLVFTNDMPIRLFYEEALQNLDIESTVKVHNSVMALFFSRYDATALRNNPKKNNTHYFNDFILFLREAWKAFFSESVKDSNHVKQSQTLLNALSIGLFESRLVFEDAAHYLYFHITKKLQRTGDKKELSPGHYISEIYDELYRFFAQYPNGPLFKAIDRLLEPSSIVFDPIILGVLPSLEGKLQLGDKSINVIRTANPITQSSILYANCNDEFLGFLKAKGVLNEKILVLNIQDRQSKKDRARSRVLEENLGQVEYRDYVISFSFPEPEDTLKLLEKEHGEQETFSGFFDVLKQEFLKPDAQSSFFLSKDIKKEILEFLNDSLKELKEIFFSKKKILFKNDKFLLLHIIYYLIVFKLVEITDPDNIIVTSKDGLDYAAVFVSGFIFFSKEKDWDEHQLKLFMTKLLSPTLIARDRLIFSQHIDLLSKFVNCLRKNRHHICNLQPFFKYNLERWDFSNYLNEIIEVSHKHSL